MTTNNDRSVDETFESSPFRSGGRIGGTPQGWFNDVKGIAYPFLTRWGSNYDELPLTEQADLNR